MLSSTFQAFLTDTVEAAQGNDDAHERCCEAIELAEEDDRPVLREVFASVRSDDAQRLAKAVAEMLYTVRESY